MPEFLGFDHVDARVRSLRAVEAFYDRLMPELGLTEKRHFWVDEAGEWRGADGGAYNTVEYHEKPTDGKVGYFIGFIEDSTMKPTATRIAFRVASQGGLNRWVDVLKRLGALSVEPSASFEEYPAIFFEDAVGTKLEIVARKPEDNTGSTQTLN